MRTDGLLVNVCHCGLYCPSDLVADHDLHRDLSPYLDFGIGLSLDLYCREQAFALSRLCAACSHGCLNECDDDPANEAYARETVCESGGGTMKAIVTAIAVAHPAAWEANDALQVKHWEMSSAAALMLGQLAGQLPRRLDLFPHLEFQKT